MNFLDVFWRKDWETVPGLGSRAWTSPGAFNLVEAIHHGATNTLEALADFKLAAAHMNTVVDGNSEFWFIVCQGRDFFTKWLEDHDAPVGVATLVEKFEKLNAENLHKLL